MQFRLGRVTGGACGPGPIFIIPLVGRVHRVSLRMSILPPAGAPVTPQANGMSAQA